ncbi:MAG: hypothetical protein ACREOS_07510 [Candidatus Dormibacteraceae bacterium]
MPPAIIVLAILTLILSQLFYAFLPYRRRAYLPVLLMALLGVLLGQLWSFVGLPAKVWGEADLLPGVIFALALQPLAQRVPIRWGSNGG